MELVALNVNGRTYNIAVEKNWTLLYTLREVMDLTGTKCGCSTGDCGSCKVIIDGEAVNSCSVRAMDMGGKAIETIEGISPGHVSFIPSSRHSLTAAPCSAVSALRAWSWLPRLFWIRIRIQRRRKSRKP